jgi:glycosyltransferase involved in cell wall biosynthesis
MDAIRIACAVSGDALSSQTQSGVAAGTITSLSSIFHDVSTIDTSLSRAERALCAATCPWLRVHAWRHRLNRGACATTARTRNLERALERSRPDVVLLIRNTYRPVSVPYVPFIDTTFALVRRQWRPWSPWTTPAADRLQKIEERYLRGAAHVAVASELVGRSVVDGGVPAERVSVVGGGANIPVATRSVAGSTDPVVLFVGRERERKGLDVLLDAFRRLRTAVARAELWVVGVDPRTELAGVRVFGSVRDREELRALYRQARVFALPARFEPYGLVLLEAMSQGVPCVGTRVGAIPEIVSDGETGLLVPAGDAQALADALLEYLADPERAQAAGEAALADVQGRLSWEHVAQRLAPLLIRVARP